MTKTIRRFFALMTAVLISASVLTACAGEETEDGEKKLITVGFSQVGSESSWRVANSESMKSALSEDKGFELIFDDAKQKQENQYKSIRIFIQQQVDYIVLAPITESGWDDVLKEAKDAGIPVIIVDRQVDSDPELYACWLGSDFTSEGEKAARWLEGEIAEREKESGVKHDKVNIFHLMGTKGATAQLKRTEGIEEAVKRNPNWEITASLEGDYTEAQAYEITMDYLKKNSFVSAVTDENGNVTETVVYPRIDVVYCENDNMTFGVMRAFDEAGIGYGGKDGVIMISFDAVSSALEACLEGRINLCVECNPLHGPRIVSIIDLMRHGVMPEKMNYVDEMCFSYRTVTEDMISSRAY